MSTEIDNLKLVADEVGGTLRLNYTGRGMYGKTCVGITCYDRMECVEAAIAHGIRGAVTDSMGKGFIVYWPKISGEAKGD
jgi:hypothetical protein